jgi:HD-GYP domain-containing protein (c-di-GMP phosphodiesterase class II)
VSPTTRSLAPATGEAPARLTVQGRNLAMQLGVLLRTARIHDVGNVAFQGPLVSFIETVDQIWTAEGNFKLQAIGDYLYINQNRLRVDASSYATYQFLIEEFRLRAISGFVFTGRLSPQEVKKFARLFLDVDVKAADPFEDFSAALAKLSVERLVPMRTVVPQAGAVDTAEVRDSRRAAKRTFYRAIEATKTVMLGSRDHRSVDLRKAKRAVQSIVDLILNEEYSVIGLTALKNHDEYTFNHCVNVTILSIAVGNRIGLTKKMLGDLGVTAILHDLGKAAIPAWVLNKPGKLSPEEWRMMTDHPAQGVKMIARLRGLNDLALRSMLVAYEHHLNYDRSGYPKLEDGLDRQTLYGRIVSIADCFDAMTAHRAYRRSPFTPYEALRYMVTENREKFDPLLLRAFVHTVGMYPAGTVVLLDTNEIAVVTSHNPAHLFRPNVKVVRDQERRPFDGPTLNLLDPGPDGRGHVAGIVSALNPDEYGVNIADALT